MISKLCRKYCDDLNLVENYQDAINDENNLWICHHRLETHYKNGRKRKEYLDREQLIKNRLYYHRPANELIFLTIPDHIYLHKYGIPRSENDKLKIKEGMKYITEKERERRRKTAFKMGINNLGKKLSLETKENIRKGVMGKNKGRKQTKEARRINSICHIGIHRSEDTKRKLSEYFKGMKVYNNGIITIRAKSCPEGFVPGRIKKN